MVEYWENRFKIFMINSCNIPLTDRHNLFLNYEVHGNYFYIDIRGDDMYFFKIKHYINPPDRQKWLDALHQLLERTVHEW